MEAERVKDSVVVEVSNSADPEVPEKPRRRRFTAEYKLSIVAEADACRAELEPRSKFVTSPAQPRAFL